MISVCICTRDRPETLELALASLVASELAPGEVIVSDDGDASSGAVELVCAKYEDVRVIRGPRRGLCANRNTALAQAGGELVLLLDDDAEVEPNFFTQIAAYRAAADDPDHLIVTGVEIRDGFVIEPHEQSFLGFQNIPYEPGDTVQTIVMNATVFPAALFERVRFDERLAYGYDEVDVATRAVASGYRIEICRGARVRHRLSPIHRDANYQHMDAARLYVTTRRYGLTQGRPLKGAAYFMVASTHIVAASARRDGWHGVMRGIRSVWRGAERLLAARRRQEVV